MLRTLEVKGKKNRPPGSTAPNFSPQGALDAYDFFDGVGMEGVRMLGTFCVLPRVASRLKMSTL